MVTIRKNKDKDKITIEQLMSNNFCNKEEVDLIERAIKKGKNIIITGKMGCGKTTLIRALLQEVDKEMDIKVHGCDCDCNYDINRNPKSVTTLNVFNLSDRFSTECMNESIKNMIINKYTIIDICSENNNELLDFMLKSYLSSCKRDIEKINSMKECVDMIVVINNTFEGHKHIKEIIEF